jgi:hypothetical protein
VIYRNNVCSSMDIIYPELPRLSVLYINVGKSRSLTARLLSIRGIRSSITFPFVPVIVTTFFINIIIIIIIIYIFFAKITERYKRNINVTYSFYSIDRECENWCRVFFYNRNITRAIAIVREYDLCHAVARAGDLKSGPNCTLPNGFV